MVQVGPLAADSPDESDSSSSNSESSDYNLGGPAHRSQLFKRPPRFQKSRIPELLSYNDEGDEANRHDRNVVVAFPFAQSQKAAIAPGTTVERKSAEKYRNLAASSIAKRTDITNTHDQPAKSEIVEASASFASSASEAPRPTSVRPGPLSPRHRAELARLSPRRKGSRREGSEGTPSMGSSFSDIDGKATNRQMADQARHAHGHYRCEYQSIRSGRGLIEQYPAWTHEHTEPAALEILVMVCGRS